MEEPEDKSTMDSEPFNMEACRICLATDVKMYSLNDPYLAGCMKEIGLNDESRHWLPKYICYECVPTLMKCNKFVEKSKVVEDILYGFYSRSQVIIKKLIKEQHRLQMKLQSPLKCYLLQNYYYIKHDDGNDASNDDTTSNQEVKEETDDGEEIGLMEILARYVPMRLISPLSDDHVEFPSPQKEPEHCQTSEAVDPTQEVQSSAVPVSTEIVDDEDNDVVAIEDEVPVVEILSDDEKTADDPKPDHNSDGLMYLSVTTDTHDSRSFVVDQSMSIYPKKRIALSDIPIPKPRKKKKKKRKEREEIEDEDCVKRNFRIEVVKTKGRLDKKYTCKYCSKLYSYGDEAKDHYLLGCPKGNVGHSSSSLTPSSGVKIWQDWPGNS